MRNPNWQTAKPIAVIPTVIAAYGQVFAALPVLAYLAAAPLVVDFAASAIISQLFERPYSLWLTLAGVFISQYAYASFEVSWYDHVLNKRMGKPNIYALPFERREGLVFLLATLRWGMMVLLGRAAQLTTEGTLMQVNPLLLLLSIAVAIAYLRICLAFPAIGAGEAFDLKRFWQRGRGNVLTMLLAIFVAEIPFLFIIIGLSAIGSQATGPAIWLVELVIVGVKFLNFAINFSVLAVAYRDVMSNTQPVPNLPGPGENDN